MERTHLAPVTFFAPQMGVQASDSGMTHGSCS